MGNGKVTFRVGERRSGKTTRILEWLKEALRDEKKAVVICYNENYADLLYRRAKSEGLEVTKSNFVTVNSAQHGALRGLNARVAVDEGQYVLQALLGSFDVEFVTATGVLDHD